MKFIKKIFEIKNINEKHKQISLFGIHIKLKRKNRTNIMLNDISEKEMQILNLQKNMLSDIDRIIQNNVSTMFLHQKTFMPFKECHKGEDIVIVASGPTAKHYNKPINAVHIAVNRSFQLESVNFKYIFIQDYSGPTKTYIEDLIAYKPDTCRKFFGLTTEFDPLWEKVIPETIAIRANALRYRTDWKKIPNFNPKFAYDISTQPLGCFGSIVFPALQFALWTNPKTIYLVGCDCTTDGYFNSNIKSPEFNPNFIKNAYKEFYKFAKIYYPDTRIISINPVGLKKMFDEDIYTSSYTCNIE